MSKIVCSSCNKEIDSGNLVCPECGAIMLGPKEESKPAGRKGKKERPEKQERKERPAKPEKRERPERKRKEERMDSQEEMSMIGTESSQETAPKGEVSSRDGVVSVGSWLLTLFVMGIPLIGFIYLIVTAVSGKNLRSKKNYAIAIIIFQVIIICLFALAMVIAAPILETIIKSAAEVLPN